MAWLMLISFIVLDRFEAGLFSSVVLGMLSMLGALDDARL